MRILALQPYDTASHRALLAGWRGRSRHTFEVLSLPGRHFKWRMRQAPIDLAARIEALAQLGERFDALWCTSMLDLAALRGLSPAAAALPAVVYFHENQLAYPVRHDDPRDLHFGLTNMTSALAAVASCAARRGTADTPTPCVWWNSAYNRDSFLDELAAVLARMPDHPPMHVIDTIRAASAVHWPGIDLVERSPRASSVGPPVLLWAARWEHDKGPELFFEALEVLDRRGVGFRLSVIGERFAECPACFDRARERFADRVVRWGYQAGRGDYEAALREAGVVVSTARHEFFGIAVAEAVSAGCVPVVPNALAYPQVWGEAAVYHDQSAAGVADAIERALTKPADHNAAHAAARFDWSRIAPQFDDAMQLLV